MKKIYSIVLLIGLLSGCDSSKNEPLPNSSKIEVETISGSIEGFEDGSLQNAKFRFPSKVAVTRSGIIFVIDQNKTAIRKIDLQGIVSTVFYEENNYLECIATDSDGQPYFSNGFYIAKLVEQEKQIVAEGEGDGDLYFNSVSGMAFHPDGDLYISETTNSKIMKISKDGVLTKFAGGFQGYQDGKLEEAKFNISNGLTIAKNGDIFVADTRNYKYRKISNGQVTTIAGTFYGYSDGPALSAQFESPENIVVSDDGDLYVTGTGNAIRKISSKGIVSTIAGSIRAVGTTDGSDGEGSLFNSPTGLALSIDGSLIITDTNNHRIRKLSFK